MTGLLNSLLRRLGLSVTRLEQQSALLDLDAADREMVEHCLRFSMTGPERMRAMLDAVRYVESAGVGGDIVECGVWRGGSMMLAALTLKRLDSAARALYLFDTFEGMTAPTAADVSYDGAPAAATYARMNPGERGSDWCAASLEDVMQNMQQTGYAMSQIRLIKGKVEDTVPAQSPERIAILRLDTDWYESTRHELQHLYPRLVRGGVLIIDDYGHWQGSRRAVDEYCREQGIALLLNRIDYTGRMALKL